MYFQSHLKPSMAHYYVIKVNFGIDAKLAILAFNFKNFMKDNLNFCFQQII